MALYSQGSSATVSEVSMGGPGSVSKAEEMKEFWEYIFSKVNDTTSGYSVAFMPENMNKFTNATTSTDLENKADKTKELLNLS